MQLNEETRLQDLAEAYPWLIDTVASMDPRLKIARTAVGRALIRRSNIADVSRLSGFPVNKIIPELQKLIDEHEGK